MEINIEYLKAAALFTDERLSHKHAGVTAGVNVTEYKGHAFLWSTNSYYCYLQYLGDVGGAGLNVCISSDEIKILKGGTVTTGHKYFEENNPRARDILARVVLASLNVQRDEPAVCDFDIEQLGKVQKAAKILKHSRPSSPFIHRANNPAQTAVIQIDPTILILAMPLREQDRKTYKKPLWLTDL